jgi:nitric oxide synthase oxygenase domain/subunit
MTAILVQEKQIIHEDCKQFRKLMLKLYLISIIWQHTQQVFATICCFLLVVTQKKIDPEFCG